MFVCALLRKISLQCVPLSTAPLVASTRALAMQQRRIHAQLEAEAAALKQQRDIMSAEKEKQAQAMIERSMRMQDEARKVFEQYDVNYDNAIDPAELLQLLQDSGFPKSVIEEELLNADADGDHLISFDECTLHRDFLGGWCRILLLCTFLVFVCA